MNCPACDTELDAAPDLCPECGLSLAAVVTALSLRRTADGMLVLAEFGYLLDAQILVGRLKSAGIHAMIGSSSSNPDFGGNTLTQLIPYRVLTWLQDGSHAVQLLAEDEHWTDDELARYMSMLEEATDSPETGGRHP